MTNAPQKIWGITYLKKCGKILIRSTGSSLPVELPETMCSAVFPIPRSRSALLQIQPSLLCAFYSICWRIYNLHYSGAAAAICVKCIYNFLNVTMGLQIKIKRRHYSSLIILKKYFYCKIWWFSSLSIQKQGHNIAS